MIKLLVVCTGNVCRSPMAAALLGYHLGLVGVPATISSAGLLEEGEPASPGAVGAMKARGLDISAHRSRHLEADMLADADLVLGMACEHLREAAVLLPSAWPRVFTLKELVRRGVEAGARSVDEDLGGWLDRLHQGRQTVELLDASPDDDIADPIGMSFRAYRATARELDSLASELVELAWGARALGAPAGQGARG